MLLRRNTVQAPQCFTAGHLVTTRDRGQVPIEQIVVGDMVLTHKGRFQPVIRIQSTIAAATIIVGGHGHCGIEVTPHHRFWARPSATTGSAGIGGERYGDPQWIQAQDLVERQALWATPAFPDAAHPAEVALPAIFGRDATAAWLLGRWLGEGALGFGGNPDTVAITSSIDEAAVLTSVLAETGHRWTPHTAASTITFTIEDPAAHASLAPMRSPGGRTQLPTAVLEAAEKFRAWVLAGYLDAEGEVIAHRHQRPTVSRELAVSMRLLAQSLGHPVTITHHPPQPDRDGEPSTAVDGHRHWGMHWKPQSVTSQAPESFDDGPLAWTRVTSMRPGRRNIAVYNIEVRQDRSYVLDGIVVANCTLDGPGRDDIGGEDRHTKTDPAPLSRSGATDVVMQRTGRPIGVNGTNCPITSSGTGHDDIGIDPGGGLILNLAPQPAAVRRGAAVSKV